MGYSLKKTQYFFSVHNESNCNKASLTPIKALPLHAQVREQLRALALAEFNDGDKFYTEPELTRRLGVSQGTVRRALSDLTTEGLLERHVPRGTFVRKKPDTGFTFGVCVTEHSSVFTDTLLHHLSAESRRNNSRFTVYYTSKDDPATLALKQIQNPPNQESIVLSGHTEQMLRQLHALLRKRGYQTVNIDTLIDGYAGHYVGVDNACGINIGLSHLLELGHCRITFLANEPLTHSNTQARAKAARQFARLHRLRNLHVHICGSQPCQDSFNAAYVSMEEVMRQKPTAVFAASDPGAWAILKWCAERNIRVPEQLSVLGFDDNLNSRFMFPALTTIAQPMREIAKTAFRLSRLKLDSPAETLLLSPSLVIRDSVGPAPSKLAR